MPERSRAAIHRFHYAMLIFAASASIAAAVYSAFTASSLRNSIMMVTHTLKVQRTIDELLAENQLVETQALRFMMSQRDDFLAEYEIAVRNLSVQLSELEALTVDNSQQRALLIELHGAIKARNVWMSDGIEVARQGPLEAVAARIREGTGAQYLRETRSIARRMANVEADLLTTRQRLLDQTIVQTTTTTLLVNALALIVGGIALVSLRRGSRDLEARRIAELEAAQAERASHEKSSFLASMSHEIRTPMNAVFGFSQLLAKTKIEPQAREYIKAIQTSGRALLALINDILDLSKIEAGKLPLVMVATDIRELVDSTMAVFSESASQKKLTLRMQIAPDVPRTLVVDPHRLRQVLMNVMSNAIKYSDEGSVTLVMGSQLDALRPASSVRSCTLRFAIRDTGIGIPIERQSKLFEPFYRAVGDESEREGTGLGLAIVRRLLTLMNGTISLHSKPEEGSTFSIELTGVEIATGGAHPLDEDEQDINFARLTPSRILIVDDVAWNRDLLAAFLAEGDHQLAFAQDGEEALLVAEQVRPDMVLMDLRMPKLDGRSAAHRLRETYGDQSPTVIAISASSMSREERDVGTVFDGYIRKPVAREVLFQALVEHLGLKEPAVPLHSGTEVVTSSADLSASPEQRSASIARLQHILRDELDGTLARLRVAEVKKLSDELASLGSSGALPSITYFAERLRAAVERFDVMQMESLLQQLTDHVQAVVSEDAAR